MPSLSIGILEVAGDAVLFGEHVAHELARRVNIPINGSTPPPMVSAINTDPWIKSGKYALGWIYLPVILVISTTLFRLYNYWEDKIRIALFKEEIIDSARLSARSPDKHELLTSTTDCSTRHFFPSQGPLVPERASHKSAFSATALLSNIIALVRFVFYRPIPVLKIWRWRISLPSIATVVIVLAGIIFSLLYCFLPQPLFYNSMAYGSPPLAIRAGMMAVALMPWIVALASKVNLISMLTGIEPQRLMVLHRWTAYLCVMFAIIHAVPFWYQSVRDPEGYSIFQRWFNQQYYIFTTGIAAIAPLIFLTLHSLPILRYKAYELFVFLHVPVSWAFIGLMFWHCHNYLTSWAYLYATVVILLISLLGRVFYLNWSNPMRPSWLIGEESAVTILPENAVKVTIPTQKRWRPGQYAYLRMPGIAALDNHPFTIASLCSEDFPSNYGNEYRDLTMVFRPFGGFTRKVLNTATEKGPYKTYRAFVEGPYGGMQRQISSFDDVVFFAGGSGITAITSQLLDLIKRMRDGKATTRTVHVIWAMKRPEIMEWFKEELRICREFAPPHSVHCNFYITSANRYHTYPVGDPNQKRLSGRIISKIDHTLQDVASKRNSRIIEPDFDLKKELEDEITALPRSHSPPPKFTTTTQPYFPPPPGSVDGHPEQKDGKSNADKRVSTLSSVYGDSNYSSQGITQMQPPRPTSYHPPTDKSHQNPPPNTQTLDFGFGFAEEPTKFQKSLMRFAFLPTTTIHPHMAQPAPPPPTFQMAPLDPRSNYGSPNSEPMSSQDKSRRDSVPTWRPHDGWRTEYGRPDIAYTLRSLSKTFGRRTCVFVCGPPEMRREVSRTVAELQRCVWTDKNKDELFLHAENYAV